MAARGADLLSGLGPSGRPEGGTVGAAAEGSCNEAIYPVRATHADSSQEEYGKGFEKSAYSSLRE